MGYAKSSVDRNQGEIINDLKTVGATVHSLHRVGGGCPDLLVGYRGQNYLMEIKDPLQKKSNRALRQTQVDFHRDWRGQCCVVMTSSQALAVLGICVDSPMVQVASELPGRK